MKSGSFVGFSLTNTSSCILSKSNRIVEPQKLVHMKLSNSFTTKTFIKDYDTSVLPILRNEGPKLFHSLYHNSGTAGILSNVCSSHQTNDTFNGSSRSLRAPSSLIVK